MLKVFLNVVISTQITLQRKSSKLEVFMNTDEQNSDENCHILELCSDIVSSYVGNNKIDIGDLPQLIQLVFNTLEKLDKNIVLQATNQKPAVSIKKSYTDDFIICLEDGKKLKMLKRYLRTQFKMTPEDYRLKWNLPQDYPMVAPSYAARRSEFAKKIGLGKRGE